MEKIKEKDFIIIKYKINADDKFIKIFGEKFVNNNKNKYILIYDGNEYELSVKLNIKNVGNKTIEVKLKEIKNFTNMGYMFDGCSSLSFLPDISKWNTNNVNDISDMFEIFDNCVSLLFLIKLKIKFKKGIKFKNYLFKSKN